MALVYMQIFYDILNKTFKIHMESLNCTICNLQIIANFGQEIMEQFSYIENNIFVQYSIFPMDFRGLLY